MDAQQVHGRPNQRLFRDQAAGALYSAHVPRHRPAAGVSSFTSLLTAPHRPDRARSLPPRDGLGAHRACGFEFGALRRIAYAGSQ